MRAPREAAEALEEAVAVVRLIWSDQRSVRFDGRHYQLAGVRPGPAPVHDMQIWLGVGGPRLLRFAGRSADGWVASSGFFGPEKLPRMQQRIDDGAADARRDPASVVRAYNIFGEITRASASKPFHGSVEQWVDELTALAVETGIDTFLLGTDDDDLGQAQCFAAEVAPAVRAAVDQHRGS